jgi:hypothetical protein
MLFVLTCYNGIARNAHLYLSLETSNPPAPLFFSRLATIFLHSLADKTPTKAFCREISPQHMPSNQNYTVSHYSECEVSIEIVFNFVQLF